MNKYLITYSYMRMFGYTVTILMHVGNIMFIMSCINLKLPNNPELKIYGELQPRYFTCWNFLFHVLYSVIGLISDIKLLLNSDDSLHKPSKYFESFKKTLFTAIIWPSTWVVVAVFWPLYLYDRQLIFPTILENIISPLSNHIMHTAIIGSILWEACFQPTEVPATHKWNVFYATCYLLLYFSVLIYTYVERGIWVYPIFKDIYGTIYFPVSIISIGVVAAVSYRLQWMLAVLVWDRREKSIKIR